MAKEHSFDISAEIIVVAAANPIDDSSIVKINTSQEWMLTWFRKNKNPHQNGGEKSLSVNYFILLSGAPAHVPATFHLCRRDCISCCLSLL